ncbi:hypothetical protein Efla_005678 [Eimeria flavescens]
MRITVQQQLLLLLAVMLLGLSSSNNSSSSNSSSKCVGFVTVAHAESEALGVFLLLFVGHEGRCDVYIFGSTATHVSLRMQRLQASIDIDAQDRAQKGFIVIWMSITLIFVVILGVWYTLKIADAADPIIHNKFVAAN